MGSKESAFKTAALSEVNRHILDAACGSIAHEQQWEFFCECGDRDCTAHVVLTLDAYIALHDGGSPVLAPGHRLSQVERAKRLRSESEALRAQAEQQVNRARETLDSLG